MNTRPRLALIGTGLMGCPMGMNLLRAGYPLAVWNRDKAKAAPLVAAGATLAETHVDAVRGADIVISMLTDGTVTGPMLADPGVQEALGPGTIWVDMSSAKPSHAREQYALLRSLGHAHLDAPVSGGTKGAEDGTLAIMVGGDAEVFDRVKPVLSAMGRPVLVGPAGSGQLAKLANQAIVGITMGAVAEAMLLLERGGADPAAVRDALKGGFADSIILQQHGERMTERNFVPGGSVANQVKDLDNVLEEAARAGVTLPATQTVRDRFAVLRDEMNGENLDHSALYLELLARNGA